MCTQSFLGDKNQQEVIDFCIETFGVELKSFEKVYDLLQKEVWQIVKKKLCYESKRELINYTCNTHIVRINEIVPEFNRTVPVRIFQYTERMNRSYDRRYVTV